MVHVILWYRPLPRGLIKYGEVVRVIYLTLVAMAAYAVVLGLRFNWSVAILFGTQVRIMMTTTAITTTTKQQLCI